MADPELLRCPYCEKENRISPQQIGQSVICPACGQTFVAGAAAAPPLPTMVGYASATPRRPTDGMSIASLVCGCLLCIPIASLLAVIFGIIGIKQTADSRRGGRGLAIAGTVLGGVGLMLWLGYIAFIASFMLPALGHAREAANRVKCASNMRQIGQAIILYSNDNGGQYPPDLTTLLKNESISTAVFICPTSSGTPASGPLNLETGGHLSYKYIGQGLTSSVAPNMVVLYENDNDHGGDGMNVLFGDGHVEFFNKLQTKSMLDQLKAGHNPPAVPISGP